MARRSVIHNLFNRRRATTLSSFVTAVNLFLGVFVLIFIVVIQESRQSKTTYEFETNMEYVQINSDSQSIQAMAKQTLKKRVLNDYYFRIDYTIQQAMCQPVNVFYTKSAIQAIRTMTVQELSGALSRNSKIILNILRINGILKSSERIIETRLNNKTEKLVCGYILELFVVLNFPSTCDNDCQQIQLNKMTSKENLFGDLPTPSFKFSLSDLSVSGISPVFRIYDYSIHRSTKYLEKALFIQSSAESRFISTKYFHSNVNQSLVSMSTKDKSLFIMKQGLENVDSSSVYVSFLSLSIPNLYLRHEDGKIKIARYDQSTFFRQDATFKLLFDNRNDVVVLQTINLPKQLFITLSSDPEPCLILSSLPEQSTVDQFDTRFLFKLISAS